MTPAGKGSGGLAPIVVSPRTRRTGGSRRRVIVAPRIGGVKKKKKAATGVIYLRSEARDRLHGLSKVMMMTMTETIEALAMFKYQVNLRHEANNGLLGTVHLEQGRIYRARATITKRAARRLLAIGKRAGLVDVTPVEVLDSILTDRVIVAPPLVLEDLAEQARRDPTVEIGHLEEERVTVKIWLSPEAVAGLHDLARTLDRRIKKQQIRLAIMTLARQQLVWELVEPRDGTAAPKRYPRTIILPAWVIKRYGRVAVDLMLPVISAPNITQLFGMALEHIGLGLVRTVQSTRDLTVFAVEEKHG